MSTSRAIPTLTHLDELESEAVHIFREVAADSDGVRSIVSSRSSGSSGSSYGAETPVNSSISPANAAA